MKNVKHITVAIKIKGETDIPGAHRHDDLRECGAKTIVTGQNTVTIEGKLWAVEGDKDTHCNEGSLIASYGPGNIRISGKRVICAVGDSAESDNSCASTHPAGTTNPSGSSGTVSIYG
jgi:uncharacterized Zn-binding protein involved in type VI secretion